MHERAGENLAAVLVGDEHVVLLRRPVDPGIPTSHRSPSVIESPSQRPDREVPLRMLIDKALAVRGYVVLPLAAPHHRRDGLVFGRPSTKGQAIVALSRRRSRQPQLVAKAVVQMRVAASRKRSQSAARLHRRQRRSI
jgi:hypothetical protein